MSDQNIRNGSDQGSVWSRFLENQMTVAAGSRLGAYEIVSLIGSGGMGEVYRAKDTKLGRDVALKILPTSFTNDPERVARFRREAQVLAAASALAWETQNTDSGRRSTLPKNQCAVLKTLSMCVK